MIRGRPGVDVEVRSAGTAAPRRHSIRASLIALVASCLTPALLVSGYLVYENYDQHRARLERDAVLQARSVAAALDREFSGVISGLRVLSTTPALAAGDLRAFHQRAREALAFQIVDSYVMTDRQGRQYVNTLLDFGTPLPQTGAPPELQRVFETGRPLVTGLFIGPVTGKPVVALGVPVFRAGEIVYSLNVGLSPERIAAILQRQAMPGHWVASVLDGSGTIVARTRDPEKFVGQKATPDVMERLDSAQVEGVLTSRSKEGIPTYAGFARSSVSNWSVVVGAPRAPIEAVLFKSIIWLIAGTAAAFAVGIWFAVRLSARVSSSIRGLVEPALSLGNGYPTEHSPPTRLKEAEAVAQAIMQAGRMLKATRHLAEHDPLTGLPNRLLFDELAGSRLAEARRHGTGLALLAIDLDGFKAVNDMHGHSVGDAVLKAVASRISGLLRESDVVARMGGDEFAVLLSYAGLGDARHVGDKLVDALSAPYPGVAPAVSASLGIAMHPQAGHTVAELCEHADQALYEAKRSGKRRLAVYP
ncbi:MAG: diguanylate cyclase domain-containing protein [Caldimonas sp.]